jgi:hypothetical protein
MKKRGSVLQSDIPKMIPNPAYFSDEVVKRRLDQFKSSLAGWGESPEDYFPADYGKELPEAGGWIMLLLSVRVGKAVGETVKKITVPHLSIWYATPTTILCGKQFDGVKLPMHQAIIRTLDGDVHVWPHEYTKVDLAKYLEFTDGEGLHIRFLHPETGGFDENKLHYIRSRGISEAEAKRWLLPELNNPNFCYFEFDSEITEVFGEGYGMPYLTRINHQRRRASATSVTAPAAD